MILALTLLSGVAWTVVYVVAIRIGFQQKTYAIPAAALALNIAWESIYATRGLATDLSVQTFVNVAWAAADVLIIYTFLRYGRKELPGFVSRPMFIAWSVLLFATAYIVQSLFIVEFGWADAPKYAAFLQNLLMSGLFIAMFVARRGPRGQSIVIAVAKWIGTLAPTIALGALAGSAFILGVGVCAASSTSPISACSFGHARTARYSTNIAARTSSPEVSIPRSTTPKLRPNCVFESHCLK
jgi:hypothetical protein